MFAVL